MLTLGVILLKIIFYPDCVKVLKNCLQIYDVLRSDYLLVSIQGIFIESFLFPYKEAEILCHLGNISY